MDIFYNGRNHGEWDEDSLPRLANSLGVTVAELLEASKEVEETRKAGRAVDKEIAQRLGDQKKISRVTADGAMMGLILSAVILEALAGADDLAGAKVEISNAMSEIFPEMDSAAVMAAMVDRYRSGEIQTPIHAKGLEASMDKVEFCADTAFKIMQGANQAEGGAKPKAKPKGGADGAQQGAGPNPVTG